MTLVALFYFQSEKALYLDLVKSNMKNIASKVSHEVIVSHMLRVSFDKSKYLNSSEYQIAFYDARENKLFGNLKGNINFASTFSIDKHSIVLVDNSTIGHLGVAYIVIKNSSLQTRMTQLRKMILIIFLLAYSCVTLIGWYLAKLFLKPIRAEREKLNHFIKDTTHELNTPISAILMSLESENNEALTPKQIQRVRLSANRISELYKDLTYVFLAERIAPRQTYDLSLLIQKQIDIFEPFYIKKGLLVTTELESFSYEINEEDFIRLFNNLLSNAIKYSNREGKITITLSKNTLSIQNSGAGIAREKLQDIFKRYFRATNVGGGFGLGLHIVKMICDTYGIDIKAHSDSNQDTVFVLTF